MRPTGVVRQRDVNEGPVIFIHLSLHVWGLLALHHLLLGFTQSLIHVQDVQNVSLLSSFSPFLTYILSLWLSPAARMNHSHQCVLLSYLTGGSGYSVVMATSEPKQKTGHPTRKTDRGQSLRLKKDYTGNICTSMQTHPATY